MGGSPPRGRGKAAHAAVRPCWLRITPAWAGKRGHALKRTVCTKDHPRVGGEKPSGHPQAGYSLGSPPRGRGKAPVLSPRDSWKWITPAWAGKRLFKLYLFSCFGDHPRVGGEKHLLPVRIGSAQGSPPRGRGKVPPCQLVIFGWRITPAWAGKRWAESTFDRKRRDHPRVGGEKPATGCISPCCLGSPPRGRGKADVCSTLEIPPRITPAWAGKSYQASCPAAPR